MGFLDPGKPIVERLEQRFAAASLTVDVRTAIDAGAVIDAPQEAPCVYVIFHSFYPTQDVGHGKVQQFEQIWDVVVALRHVSGVSLDDKLPIHTDAAPVIDAVFAALCGWSPTADFSAMKLQPGEGPVFTAGYAYYEIFFTTRTVVRGVN
jgi:hypothetical protein